MSHLARMRQKLSEKWGIDPVVILLLIAPVVIGMALTGIMLAYHH